MTKSSVAEEVEIQERAWASALQEQHLAILSKLLHDDFTSTSARSRGEVLSKREYIGAALQMRVCDYEITDVNVREMEVVAVFKARLTCHSKFNEQDIHDDLLITDVWLRDGNRWKAVTRHASVLPK